MDLVLDSNVELPKDLSCPKATIGLDPQCSDELSKSTLLFHARVYASLKQTDAKPIIAKYSLIRNKNQTRISIFHDMHLLCMCGPNEFEREEPGKNLQKIHKF